MDIDSHPILQPMKFTPINFESVEQMHLWSALALQAGKTPAKEMRANTDPVPPYFVSIAPLVSGINEGDVFARVSSNIGLDENYTKNPLLSVRTDSAQDAPAYLYEGLDLLDGSGGGGNPDYVLGFTPGTSYFVWKGDVMEDGPFVVGLLDTVATNLVSFDPDLFFLSSQNGSVGVRPVAPELSRTYNGELSGMGNSDAWTAAAVIGFSESDNGYVELLSDSSGDGYIDIYHDSVEISLTGMGPDDGEIFNYTGDLNPALFIFSWDSTGVQIYRNGALLGERTTDINLSPHTWERFIQGNVNGRWILQDALLVSRKLSKAELNAYQTNVASARNIAVIDIV